jgi:exo-1,4-beta-D-glucosaminidase
VFTEALTQRYGAAGSVEDYAGKSQLMAYEGIRAMFEAYSRNKYAATGVIQWMLNNSWPGLIWHLFDYFLLPGGGYFGAKKACQPLLPLYSHDDGSIWVVNSRYEASGGLKLSAQLYDLAARERWAGEAHVELAADGTVRALTLPVVDAGPVSFLRLTLRDAAGAIVGSNFYWLSRKRETLDWANATWFRTPTLDFADFTALATLPRVRLETRSATERAADECTTRVTIENPSASLAFFVRLQVKRGDGEEIVPVLWDDNYVSLLPGEKREISARYRAKDAGEAKPVVAVSGFNIG